MFLCCGILTSPPEDLLWILHHGSLLANNLSHYEHLLICYLGQDFWTNHGQQSCLTMDSLHVSYHGQPLCLTTDSLCVSDPGQPSCLSPLTTFVSLTMDSLCVSHHGQACSHHKQLLSPWSVFVSFTTTYSLRVSSWTAFMSGYTTCRVKVCI